MLMEILEGHVHQEHWNDLEKAYRNGIRHVPHELHETYLIHGQVDPTLWRILSIWHSKEGYEKLMREGFTDACVLMFRSVDVEPTHRIFDVPAHHIQV